MSAFPHEPDLRAAVQEPTAEDVARLREGVLSAVARRRQVRGVRRVGIAAVGLAAVVVGVVLAVTRPAGPMALATGLVPLAPGVVVQADGTGVAETVGRSTTVDWSAGRIVVQVDPAAGAEVAVRTPEATVRVHGTIFAVERDRFGTSVQVDRGAVEVTCGATTELAAGGEATCLRDAGAGLGRVLALEVAGASSEDRLAAVELALAHPLGGDDARAELRRRRTALLAELAGRHLALGDCDAAAPFLAALSADGDPDAARAEQACRER